MKPVSIVFVDDDDVSRICFARLLRGLPCCLESYACPLSCIEELTLSQPQLLFVDMQMPRMNGIELLEKIQAHWGTQHCDSYLCSAVEPSAEILHRVDAMGVSAACKDVVMNKQWLSNCIAEYCH